MQRTTASFSIDHIFHFKQQTLSWLQGYDVCCFLDSNGYPDPYHSYDCLVAAGAHQQFHPSSSVLTDIDAFLHETGDWLFGHFNYEFNTASPVNKTYLNKQEAFPGCLLFQPLVVIEINQSIAIISCLQQNPQDVFNQILQTTINTQVAAPQEIIINPVMTKADYLLALDRVMEHIARGDCYELNYCQQFFANDAVIDPLQIFNELINISPTPFAAFYKSQDNFLLCASPERFIKKDGRQLISQPVKGTAKRQPDNTEADELLKQMLLNNPKERSEHIMIVDLVRNDLSKVCMSGSVTVDAFDVYSFAQVHQLISTVKGVTQENISFSNIFEACFPMGSMTGAPKKKVLELIEQFEPSTRGIYSGCAGYINPQNDFDFNVVIRSITYNSREQFLSYYVGGGITANSIPLLEYEECLLKASAIKKVLQKQHS